MRSLNDPTEDPARDREPPVNVTHASRAAALLALPFQLGFVVVAFLLNWAGANVDPAIALLLVPTLWLATAAQLLFRTEIPLALQLYYLLFMTGGPYAGSALNVYGYIDHWDKLVHFASGTMLAWAGMLVVRRMEERVGVPLPRWFGLTVSFAAPMAVAAAWEICEFTSDHLLGTHAQNGNTDTMGDIISATIGALLTLGITLSFRRPRSILPSALRVRATDARDEQLA